MTADRAKQLFVDPTASLRTVIEIIDRNATGLALVVDADQRLLGTISDGDIRRAILMGVDLTAPAQSLMSQVKHPPRTAPLETPHAELLVMMQVERIRQIPLLDGTGRVADVALLSDLVNEEILPVRTIVMAGGLGSRLMPLTEHMPKPMLPLGDRPLLEHTLRWLKSNGVRRVVVTTHYLADVIRNHLGDGQALGLDIAYLHEEQPLGTAGALAMCDHDSAEPILLLNGDILTALDFRKMLQFHRDHDAILTVGICRYDAEIPFGVMELDGSRITGMKEKPTITSYINGGIYLIEPRALDRVPEHRRFDMNQLVEALLAAGQPVFGYLVREYWRDIGHIRDYHRANEEMAAANADIL